MVVALTSDRNRTHHGSVLSLSLGLGLGLSLGLLLHHVLDGLGLSLLLELQLHHLLLLLLLLHPRLMHLKESRADD